MVTSAWARLLSPVPPPIPTSIGGTPWVLTDTFMGSRLGRCEPEPEPPGDVAREGEQQPEEHDEGDDAAAGRPGAAAGPEPDPPGVSPLHGLALLEVLDRLGGRAGIDPPLLIRVAGQQAMVADDVDDARDPL